MKTIRFASILAIVSLAASCGLKNSAVSATEEDAIVGDTGNLSLAIPGWDLQGSGPISPSEQILLDQLFANIDGIELILEPDYGPAGGPATAAGEQGTYMPAGEPAAPLRRGEKIRAIKDLRKAYRIERKDLRKDYRAALKEIKNLKIAKGKYSGKLNLFRGTTPVVQKVIVVHVIPGQLTQLFINGITPGSIGGAVVAVVPDTPESNACRQSIPSSSVVIDKTQLCRDNNSIRLDSVYAFNKLSKAQFVAEVCKTRPVVSMDDYEKNYSCVPFDGFPAGLPEVAATAALKSVNVEIVKDHAFAAIRLSMTSAEKVGEDYSIKFEVTNKATSVVSKYDVKVVADGSKVISITKL